MPVPELYSPATQTAAGGECDGTPPPRQPHRPLPLWVRILVLVVGWIVVLIGIAGLVLPGIQGIATIVAGAAILSVASELCLQVDEEDAPPLALDLDPGGALPHQDPRQAARHGAPLPLSVYSSRSAVATGMRAARRAGKSPPTNPISSA